jgi:ABC-2 type transport system permease protein
VLSRPLAIAWKELIQLRRDRPTLAMMAVLPLLQLMLFGYAINSDVRHMPTVVFDQDRTAESRSLAERMRATGFYDLLGEVRGYDEIERALRQGAAKVALVVPPLYGSRVTRGTPARVQLIVDGSDPQTVASATNTAASLVQADAAELVVKRFGAAAGELVGVDVSTWYNPEIRTAVYVVPGLIGVILTMTMVMLTSMAIARERERGTLEQLIVSPIRSVELVIGKIFPFIGIGYVQMTLILTAGHFLFEVPIIGSLALLYVLAFVFIAANLALGLVFSTVARTQQQAMQMSFFFLLPNILLSGFMFPFEGMPRPAQILSTGLPLTHFLRIVRAITLKGGDFADVQRELLWLAGILGVLIAFASTRFRKKLG